MKINVGDYVRTKYNGILKIRNIKEEETFNEYYEMGRKFCYKEKKTLLYYRDDDRTITTNEVVKASHNIIDLIEVGDYVNGELVVAIHEHYVCDEIELGTALETACNYTATLNEDIKSIVTKEQFSSISYEVSKWK